MSNENKKGRKRLPEDKRKKQIATRIDPGVRDWLRDQKYMSQAVLIEKAVRYYRELLEKSSRLKELVVVPSKIPTAITNVRLRALKRVPKI